jgi:DnaK suppressor protein
MSPEPRCAKVITPVFGAFCERLPRISFSFWHNGLDDGLQAFVAEPHRIWYISRFVSGCTPGVALMPQAKKKTAKASKTSKTQPKKSAKTTTKKTAKTSPAKKKKTAAKAAKKTASKSASPKKKTATNREAGAAATTAEHLLFKSFKPYVPAKGEEYMNDRQVEHFRNLLLAWKRELMEEVDRTVHHMQDEAANFPDPNDRATQESEFSLELRTRDRERKLIKKIDEALESLEEGEYGYCESCGVEIGIRRLEARPTATLCIDCKTLDEIRERQMG